MAACRATETRVARHLLAPAPPTAKAKTTALQWLEHPPDSPILIVGEMEELRRGLQESQDKVVTDDAPCGNHEHVAKEGAMVEESCGIVRPGTVPALA